MKELRATLTKGKTHFLRVVPMFCRNRSSSLPIVRVGIVTVSDEQIILKSMLGLSQIRFTRICGQLTPLWTTCSQDSLSLMLLSF